MKHWKPYKLHIQPIRETGGSYQVYTIHATSELEAERKALKSLGIAIKILRILKPEPTQ